MEYAEVSDFREHFTVPRWKKPWPFAWRYGAKDQYDQVLKWLSQQRHLRSLEIYIAMEGVYSTEFRCVGGQGLRFVFYFKLIIYEILTENHLARTGFTVATILPVCRLSMDVVVSSAAPAA